MLDDQTKHDWEQHVVPHGNWTGKTPEWYASFGDICPGCGAKPVHVEVKDTQDIKLGLRVTGLSSGERINQ